MIDEKVKVEESFVGDVEEWLVGSEKELTT